MSTQGNTDQQHTVATPWQLLRKPDQEDEVDDERRDEERRGRAQRGRPDVPSLLTPAQHGRHSGAQKSELYGESKKT